MGVVELDEGQKEPSITTTPQVVAVLEPDLDCPAPLLNHGLRDAGLPREDLEEVEAAAPGGQLRGLGSLGKSTLNEHTVGLVVKEVEQTEEEGYEIPEHTLITVPCQRSGNSIPLQVSAWALLSFVCSAFCCF